MVRAVCRLSIIACLLLAAAVYASGLPGQELTDERIHNSRLRRGDASAAAVDTVVRSAARTELSWIEATMNTWNAPSLAAQQSADETNIPFGKGGVFIPTMTEINSEPDIEVFDKNGNLVASGETGRSFALEPGEYLVTLGSGTAEQRIHKPVRVEEGRTLPLIPDWSGLLIDVVDEQGIALKGEYELVRIDEFDPYGRGYGASIELGETVRAWILKPGIYKILGAGEGYQTMTNFVTVRLMPGELTSFLLIQDPENNYRIRGGGTVHLTPSTKLTSNWLAGANVGANVQLNAETDHQANAGSSNSFTMGFMLDAWVLYRKKPVEWSTRLRLDQSLNITDNSIENMINNPDRVQMSSIFIWRILNWVGPYARGEFNTRLFQNRIRRSKNETGFVFVDENYFYTGTDTVQVFTIEPGLSPTIFELGAGINADLTTRRYFEARVRAGFGTAYSRYDDRYRVIEENKVTYNSPDSLEQKLSAVNSIILYPEDRVNILELGPQMSLGATVRIGAVASAEGEIKLFAPVLPEQRITKPDIEVNGTFSWRLSRILNLDYTYRQNLKRPAELDVPVHTSTHGIWLRLHYSSR
ncbi:MAG: DUF3078 domain-containing protein [Chitinispirillia bacterium]|nr:DUF3078 domain-containing protein [Chitinispirillia bacterium]MCL2242650.1 DUF3078 domain-containing protein [Chitinispirillia bacterium]